MADTCYTKIILLLSVFLGMLVDDAVGQPRVWHISPRAGSLEGGTVICIYGTDFADDQFNYFNKSLGHRVDLYNSTASIPCDVMQYFSSSTKICCKTRQMISDDYQVSVFKDGTEISKLEGSYCNGISHRCRFSPGINYTPLVQTVTPSSGFPESEVAIYGRWHQGQYSAQSDESDSNRKIKRVELGGRVCNLTDPETGELYGITPINEGSHWATVIVKPTGRVIGSHKFNFTISSHFGGSMAQPASLKVSGQNKLYHYQTHAEITSVEPASGSCEGGTLLTIRGNYFPNRTSSYKVLVGGVPCEVQTYESESEITCITGKSVENPGEMYPGSRGAIFDKWNTPFPLNNDRSQWTTLMPERSEEVIEGSTPVDTIDFGDHYVGCLKGYFVPPRTGMYKMAIRGDDVSKLWFSDKGYVTTNLTMVAEGIRYTGWNWFKFPEQISAEKFNLTAGVPYYYEACYREYGGQDWVQVGAMLYDADFVSTDIVGALNERQRISVISDVDLEIQSVTIEGAKEVQQVIVSYTGCKDSISYEMVECNDTADVCVNGTVEEVAVDCEVSGSFKLTYNGNETGFIALNASAEDVETELGKLSSLNGTQYRVIAVHSVTVQPDGLVTSIFDVTFDVHEDLSEMTVAVTDAVNMDAQVNEISPGTTISSDEPLAFSYDGKVSQPLTLDSSAVEVQDALLDLFSVKCAKEPNSGIFFDTFEEEPTGKSTGVMVSDEEPFCGRMCLQNPTLIFEAGEIRDGLNRYQQSFSFSRANKLCFAVKGVLSKSVKFTVTFFKDGAMKTESHSWKIFDDIDGDFIVSNEWSYRCVNLETMITHSMAAETSFRISQIEFGGNTKDDYYIDNLYIGTSTIDARSWNRQPAAKPNGILVADVNVTKSDSTFTVTMTPANCGHNFPLLGIDNAQMHSGSAMADSDEVVYLKRRSGGAVSFKVERLSEASPPATGQFTMEWKGSRKTTVPANIEAKQMKKRIEKLGTGIVKVVRSGQCFGYSWDIEWTSTGGSQPLIQVDDSKMSGNNVNINVSRLQEGALLLGPIPGEFLRVPYNTSQVEVFVNGIPSLCNGTCAFTCAVDDTPTVTGVTPVEGKSGTSITISGSGFSATVADNQVQIGGVGCVVTSASATSIECTVGQGAAGSDKVIVDVSPNGLASHPNGDIMFEYTWAQTGVSPSTGSKAGGTELTVTGYGFCSCSGDEVPEDPITITVGGHVCEITSISYDQIVCTIVKIKGSSVSRKKRETSTGAVVINNGDGNTLTGDNSFSFSATPEIATMTPSSSSAQGGGNLVLTGTEFGDSGNKVTIGSTECVITAESTTEITCTLPAHEPGLYDIKLSVAGVGFADTSKVSSFTYTPKVTGVSPSCGSVMGGTKVTISGEGFGTDASLVSVAFGKSDCEIESVAEEKIVCHPKHAVTIHKIDNQGRHEEYGQGYRWDKDDLDVAVGDIVCWSWSVPEAVTGILITVRQTATEDANDYDGTGFHAGQPSSRRTGEDSYCYTFKAPGKYFYSSEEIHIGDTTLYMKGVVDVAANSAAEQVTVKVGDYEAWHDKSQKVADTCNDNDLISPCDTNKPTLADAQRFAYIFYTCKTPVIESVNPNSGDSNTLIKIHGAGFREDIDQNEVKIGVHVCQPTSVSATKISCKIDTGSTPIAGLAQFLSVNVANHGLARYKETQISGYTFMLQPKITSLSVTEGSTEGGTGIKISGNGFSTDVTAVSIGGSVCVITDATYTQIVCTTSRAPGPGTYPVSAGINGASATCPDGCDFTYSEEMTPNVETVSPAIVSGATTEITITGTRLSGIVVDVKIGGVDCTVSQPDSSDTKITCSVGYVPVGRAVMTVNIAPSGEASFSNSEARYIESSNDIVSVTPNSGSKNGGQEVTIVGNGFHIDDTSVTIAGKECVVTSITLSEVKCITPAKSKGTYPLVVTSGIHTYEEQTYEYSNDQTPSVTSVDPASGKSGDDVTIAGDGFSETMSDNTVTIDGVECVVSSASVSSIVCAVGVHSAGAYLIEVHVKEKGLASSESEFEYELSITSTTPNTGSFGGGLTLTIEGIGFGDEDTTTVSVCGNTCPILSITATKIECDVPGNSDTGETLDCDIEVILSSEAKQVSSNAWQYRRDMTPIISSTSPKRGGTGGGTTVTIDGTGFSESGNKVTIEGTECVVKEESSTQITCRTGEHSGTIKTKVRLEVGDNGIAPQDNADFFYVDRWSSKFTWGGKDPPIEGDLVVIDQGQTVLLDVDTPILKMLLIQGSCLIFDEEQASITLNSEHILIVDGGCLQVGTEEEPYHSLATIMLHGHQKSKELPLFGSKTLAVRNGTLDLHGIHIPLTWTHLAETILAGATQIKLMKQVTWKTGDQIALASTSRSPRENEELTITGVSDDGLTLTFKPPVKYDHISMVQSLGGATLETRAEVGLLTRNVVVRGSVHSEWTETIEECEEEFQAGQFKTQSCFKGRYGEETGSDQFGVQIMFFAKESDKHLATGRLSYIEVTHAGQAFRLGRYPIHFHLNGNVTGNYVRGCAIHHTFNRAVTIHAVHHLLVEHNVAYDIMGHAYFMEDGIETKNIIQYNLAMFVRSSSSLLNVDITPAAFWVTNPDNIVRHNAAAGGTHFGFWYNPPEHPGGPSFTNKVCPRNVPLLEFRNNSAHSFGRYGLWIFPVYHPRERGEESCGNDKPSIPAEFDSFTGWNLERAAEAVEVGNVRFNGFLVSDTDLAGIEFQTTNDDWGGPFVKDATIIGYSELSAKNKAEECSEAGIKLPKSNYLTIQDVQFINFDQGRCAAIRSCSHCKTEQGGFYSIFEGIQFVNSPNKAAWQWEHEHCLVDADGSLTGSEDYKVVPQNENLPKDNCQFNVEEFSVGGVKGAVCNDQVKFHRMAFNNVPAAQLYKAVQLTNSHGVIHIPYHKKRITHGRGWMTTLIDGESYNLVFENADQMTNISYNARLDDFADGNFVSITHNLATKPDRVAITGPVTDGSSAVPTYGANNHGEWYFDDNDNGLTYIVSGKGEAEPRDYNINLNVYQCFYEDCIPPAPDVPQAPPDERPDDFKRWSDPGTWVDLESGWGSGEGVLPIEGANVMIKPGEWVVADISPIPKLGKLFIYGTLELGIAFGPERDQDFALDATHILIQGGRLIAGQKDKPYTGNGLIVLSGKVSDAEIDLPFGIMGPKTLGAFGGLDLHGVSQDVYWTHLASTASPGDDTITVVEATDWQAGYEIVVTATSYDPWHTETFKIREVAADMKTFTLNSTIQHKHSANEEITSKDGTRKYTMSAEVGLFTRNLKIESNDYDDLLKESFGSRVVVGSFTANDGKLYRGYARISNVEFYHSGQEGFIEAYDPRYSLAFSDTGEVDDAHPSYVTGCSFHNGFSPAIGLFEAHGVPVVDNVIHHVVGPGMVVQSSNNEITHNLVSLVIFPGTYQDRNERENLMWFGGFEIQNARNLNLRDNTVAGSERAGYKMKGEPCDEGVWNGNVAHGALHGIHIYPDSQPSCSLISSFFLWHNFDFGIYIQAPSSMIMSNLVLVDNRVGIFSQIVGPPALSHKTSDKSVRVENSLIVGYSTGFECGVDDKVIPDVASHAKSHSNKEKSPGHVGIAISTFASSTNGAPFKKFTGVMSYPAISGHTDITNTKFDGFGPKCSKPNFMIKTNKASGDFQHPVQLRQISTDTDVKKESWFYIDRPPLSLVNPSDCVDMDCDGMKKVLIRDLDGSLLGSVGTVIPQSEYEWDGDPNRGLGDYRIPKTMLTKPNGQKLNADDEFPNKGIYRGKDGDCNWIDAWQGYECHDLDHMIMVLESLDDDTEVRRLSPVALSSDGYVDLVNGPQDHGWCHGYTCQERISTFYAMVAMGKEYEIYFSSTNPQQMRLHLLNADENQKVVTGIYYANPQRLDVYYQGRYIMPTNGALNDDGDFVWENVPGQVYKPSLSSNVYGENYFDRYSSTLYVLVRGGYPVDIVTTPVVVVSFGVPATTVDEFFEVNLIQNLVNFLGIKPSQIRIVDIIAEDSVRRRRSLYQFGRYRRATDGTVEVIFEVGEPPAESIETDPDTDAASTTMETPIDMPTEMPAADDNSLGFEQLEEVGSKLADSLQTGELNEEIDVEVVSMAITDPEPPPVDPTGGVHATNETGGPSSGNVRFDEQQTEVDEEEAHLEVVYRIPSELVIHMEATGASESEAFIVQPKVKVLDAVGVLVEHLGHHSNPWRLCATLNPGSGSDQDAQLVGNTSVPFAEGYANFTDLAIDKLGSGYTLDFAICHPNTTTLAVDSSVGITITKREYYAAVPSAPSVAYVDEGFDVVVEIKDVITDGFPKGLDGKGYTWKASASLLNPSNYRGSLNGTMEATFDLTTAQAHFQDLTIDAKGHLYIIQFHVFTVPSSDYDFTANAVWFDVKVRGQAAHSGNTKTFTLRFDEDYDDVAKGNEEQLKVIVLNKLSWMYPNITITNLVISKGSILITFDAQGDIDSTQDQMLDDLSNGLITLSLNGYIMTADNYLLVDGKEAKAGSVKFLAIADRTHNMPECLNAFITVDDLVPPLSCLSDPASKNGETSLFAPWLVAVIVIIALLMLLITAFVVYWLCCRKKNNKINEMETIGLTGRNEKNAMMLQSMASLNSSHSSVQLGVDSPMMAMADDEALSLQDLERMEMDSPASLRKSMNTPRRTPEVAVTSLPPGFTEGQDEKLLEDRRHMSLMARNDIDGTFVKLSILNVNLVGTISDLRRDITAALQSTKWKDAFILMKETLKDIPVKEENKLTVSQIYSSDCVLLRWESVPDNNSPKEQPSEATPRDEKPQWAPVW